MQKGYKRFREGGTRGPLGVEEGLHSHISIHPGGLQGYLGRCQPAMVVRALDFVLIINSTIYHYMTQHTLGHTSLRDTTHYRTHLTIRHTSLCGTTHNRTQHYRTPHTSGHTTLQDTPHFRTHLTMEHNTVQDTTHYRTHHTIGHTTLKDTTHYMVYYTIEHCILHTAHCRGLHMENSFSFSGIPERLGIVRTN